MGNYELIIKIRNEVMEKIMKDVFLMNSDEIEEEAYLLGLGNKEVENV